MSTVVKDVFHIHYKTFTTQVFKLIVLDYMYEAGILEDSLENN